MISFNAQIIFMSNWFYSLIGYSVISAFYFSKIVQEQVLVAIIVLVIVATLAMLIPKGGFRKVGIVLFSTYLLLVVSIGLTEVLFDFLPADRKINPTQYLFTWRALVACIFSVLCVVVLIRSYWKNKGDSIFLAITGAVNLAGLLIGKVV